MVDKGKIPLKEWLAFCHNCGEKGPHYIPPSMGDPGFFSCTANPGLVAQKELELKVKHAAK